MALYASPNSCIGSAPAELKRLGAGAALPRPGAGAELQPLGAALPHPGAGAELQRPGAGAELPRRVPASCKQSTTKGASRWRVMELQQKELKISLGENALGGGRESMNFFHVCLGLMSKSGKKK